MMVEIYALGSLPKYDICSETWNYVPLTCFLKLSVYIAMNETLHRADYNLC